MTPLAERILSLARRILLLMLIVGGARPVFAQAVGQNREYEIKAAYLYNFGKYVQWPTNNEPQFLIGIVGNAPFGSAVNELQQKKLEGRSIQVHRIRAARDYKHCHMLFVSKGTPNELVKVVLNQTAQRPCLIVGEKPDFARAGGMVNFITKNNRIQFEINPEIARQSGLQISSRLLQLGDIVK